MPSASLVKEFENLIGKENVFTSEADRQSYAYDAAVLPSVVPGLVLRPTSTEQLGALIERCYANGLPMTIRGAGTNLSGGTVPDADKSVVILTQGLNKIIEINEEDLFAIVEPGVVTAQFAAAVASKGLFYPPDPGSQAVSTIGGNIAENAGGLRGLKYGVTKDYVMGLEFYDHTGELVKSGSRTVKCATGYNLGGLLVGSEGTLGMISRAILKLVPPPQASKAMMAVFDNVQKASEAVARIIAAHILPCTLEFMDNMTINLVEDDVKIGLPRDAQAILLIEVDGHAGQVADEALIVEEQLKKSGATQIVVAKDAEEKNRIWEARRKALPALARFKPTTILEDATVPRSKIPGHDEGHQGPRRKVQPHRRHLRTCRGRQSAPDLHVRQARQGRIRTRGTRRRRTFQHHHRNGRHPFRRTRHRHRQAEVAGKGNLTRHHRVLAPPAQGHRPEGPVQPQQAGWSLNHG